jgi:hypothetical protein
MTKLIRNLAWVLAITLVLATLLRLGDQLNVFAKPPDLPATANLVDRLLASIPYREAIWPVFLAWNLLLTVAFLVVIPLSALLLRALDGSDARVRAGVASLLGGAIVGAVGQLAVIGAVDVTISLPYCDCGFKETEVIAQSWAQNLIGGAGDWLTTGGLVMIALGFLWLGSVIAGRARTSTLGRLSSLVGLALVVGAVFTRTGWLDPLPDVVAAVTFGLLVPIWALWLARDAALLGDAAPGAAT